MTSATDESLARVIALSLAEEQAVLADVELVDVELLKNHLTVTIEGREGLNLEQLALASQVISAALDSHDELAPSERYELEVTSPGVERRLRRPEQFAAAVGSRVTLRTIPGSSGRRRVEGVLSAVDTDGVEIDPDGGGEPLRVGFDEVERAHTVFDWKAALADEKRVRRSHDLAATSKSKRPMGKRGVPA